MSSMRSLTVVLAVTVFLFTLRIGADAAARRMYWTDVSTKVIQRADVDGTGIQNLVTTGLSEPQGIALDVAGGKMYWVDSGTDKIQRANVDGTSVEDLVVGVGPAGIALDLADGKMYWTDVFVTGSIQRANLDGSGVENLITALCDCEGIALDVPGGKMYLTDRTFDRIQRANLDGSGLENLVTTGLSDPRGIALDLAGGKMYWTEVGTHKIQRANTDGTGTQDLVTTGLLDPEGIALDVAGGKMYWTDFGTGKVQRANLDGTDVEDLVTGLGIPVGIALEEVLVMEVTIDIEPGNVRNGISLSRTKTIPVAILSSADFDAPARVDTASLTFGRTGDEPSLRKCASRSTDVNRDKLPDLICFFSTKKTGFQPGDTVGVLSGTTLDGIPIMGSDSVRIVP